MTSKRVKYQHVFIKKKRRIDQVSGTNHFSLVTSPWLSHSTPLPLSQHLGRWVHSSLPFADGRSTRWFSGRMTCPLGSQKKSRTFWQVNYLGRTYTMSLTVYLKSFFFYTSCHVLKSGVKNFKLLVKQVPTPKNFKYPNEKNDGKNGTHHLLLWPTKNPRLRAHLRHSWHSLGRSDHPRTCKWIGNSYCWWVPKSG